MRTQHVNFVGVAIKPEPPPPPPPKVCDIKAQRVDYPAEFVEFQAHAEGHLNVGDVVKITDRNRRPVSTLEYRVLSICETDDKQPKEDKTYVHFGPNQLQSYGNFP